MMGEGKGERYDVVLALLIWCGDMTERFKRSNLLYLL